MASSCLLPQWAEIVGFQLYSIGMQIKQWASMVPIHHSTMITPMIFIASRNAGVMKTRWKSISTEVLVKKSAVHWRVPVVYQSCGCQGQHSLHERGVESVGLIESNELFFIQRPNMPPETIFAYS